MKDINQILSSIKKGDYAPVYLLMGTEPFFIDQVKKVLSSHVVEEHARDFDSTIFYGKETLPEQIIETAKRFPMMGSHQLVVVREAQYLDKTIDFLVPYLENPQSQTVLVLCYKHKKLDKRKKSYKAIAKSGVVLETKPLYDNQVADWIKDRGLRYGFNFHPHAPPLLVSFLGTDLSKISNELSKLMLVLPKETIINDKHIEDNIGISKDFNNFELRKAVGEKQIVKANRIINYFAENPKNNPLVMTVSLLNGYFTQLLMFHGLKDKSKNSVAKNLGVNPYFVDEYFVAARNYPMRKVAQVIAFLRDADVKSKGVGANQSNEDILKELLFKILH